MIHAAIYLDQLYGNYQPKDRKTRKAAELVKQAEAGNVNFPEVFGISVRDLGADTEGLTLTIYVNDDGFYRHEIASVYLHKDKQINYLRDALNACLALRETDAAGEKE